MLLFIDMESSNDLLSRMENWLVSSVSSKIGKENWKAMANPNPNSKNRFKKGHAPSSTGRVRRWGAGYKFVS